MLAFVGVLTLLAAVQATPQILIQSEDIAAAPDVIIVDARSMESFKAGHIPGACHVDPDTLSEERGGVAGMLRPAKALQMELQELGLRPDKTLVLYSEMAAPSDTKRATRLFWILEYLGFPKVALLDGGYAKWTAEKRGVEMGGPAPRAEGNSTWELEVRPELLADYEQIIDSVQSGEACLLDLRSAEEYTGVTKKPFLKQAGHISGATNLEAGSLVEMQELNGKVFCTFVKSEPLKTSLSEAVGDWERPVTTYCNSGRDATVGYFGLRLEGHEHLSVYDGSMLEWDKRNAPAPVE